MEQAGVRKTPQQLYRELAEALEDVFPCGKCGFEEYCNGCCEIDAAIWDAAIAALLTVGREDVVQAVYHPNDDEHQPCPFCGCEEFEVDFCEFDNQTWEFVRCMNCHASGPLVRACESTVQLGSPDQEYSPSWGQWDKRWEEE
jgi:hypothetical protein